MDQHITLPMPTSTATTSDTEPEVRAAILSGDAGPEVPTAITTTTPGSDGLSLGQLTLLLGPFAPYTTQELWEEIGGEGAVFKQNWPTFNPNLALEDEIEIPVQVNGKLRAKLLVAVGTSEAEIEKLALSDPKVQPFIAGKTVAKVILAGGKLVSIVVK